MSILKKFTHTDQPEPREVKSGSCYDTIHVITINFSNDGKKKGVFNGIDINRYHYKPHFQVWELYGYNNSPTAIISFNKLVSTITKDYYWVHAEDAKDFIEDILGLHESSDSAPNIVNGVCG